MMTGGQNDYSACTTWLTHKNDAYLLHVYRGRLEYPELRCKVIGLAAEHRATTVLIENAGPGMNLLQDLRAAMPQGMTRPIGVKPEGSKVDRMAAQSAKIEQHETGKPLHIKGLLRILIPPFPGSNPGAPASQFGLCGVISACARTAKRVRRQHIAFGRHDRLRFYGHRVDSAV